MHIYRHMYNNIKDRKCQEELKKEFLPKKKENILLAECYSRIFLNSEKIYENFDTGEIKKVEVLNNRAEKVENCATWLTYGKTTKAEFKLFYANFCRDRLCPMCSWRRSLKIFSQVSRIMDVIEHDYRFIFLTLTVPNVSGSELKQKIDDMQYAWREVFCKNKKFKTAVKGFFRSLEVTHDTNKTITAKKYNKAKKYYDDRGLKVGDDNPNYDKYHPHYHCILAVNSSYLKKKEYYITRDEWLDMWRYAMNDYSITQVDVRVCKNKERLSKTERMEYKKLSSAVCEVAKYSVKSNDYIVKNDEDLTDSTVETLFLALHGRKLCGLGGVFNKTWKQVKGKDKEIGEGDLVDINGKLREDIFVQLYRYQWSNGCYKLVQVDNVSYQTIETTKKQIDIDNDNDTVSISEEQQTINKMFVTESVEIIDDVQKNTRYAVNSATGEVEKIGQIVERSRPSERPARTRTRTRQKGKKNYCDDLENCVFF